jgi:hypothetical protein
MRLPFDFAHFVRYAQDDKSSRAIAKALSLGIVTLA